MTRRTWAAARKARAEVQQAARADGLAMYHDLCEIPAAGLWLTAAAILRGRTTPTSMSLTPLQIVALRYDVCPRTVEGWLAWERAQPVTPARPPVDNSDLI